MDYGNSGSGYMNASFDGSNKSGSSTGYTRVRKEKTNDKLFKLHAKDLLLNLLETNGRTNFKTLDR